MLQIPFVIMPSLIISQKHLRIVHMGITHIYFSYIEKAIFKSYSKRNVLSFKGSTVCIFNSLDLFFFHSCVKHLNDLKKVLALKPIFREALSIDYEFVDGKPGISKILPSK